MAGSALMPLLTLLKGKERILVALALFVYLTAAQITKLLYAPSSYSHVRKEVNELVAEDTVLAVSGRYANLPTLYTLSSKGQSAVAAIGAEDKKRVRPSEERDKAANVLFVKHTIAVSDVLVAALLLSRRHPDITLSRLYTERALKRKLYVPLAVPGAAGQVKCIEPDAGCEFTIADRMQDFFFIEVYRTLPPAEWRFKQKVTGYVTYAGTGQQEKHFATPAMGIAVFCASPQMAATLRRWTEETLQEIGQPEQGERFFFRSGDVASASPAEMFLTPFWQQPFSDTKTPLIVREELM
jgi:hypothetical protein